MNIIRSNYSFDVYQVNTDNSEQLVCEAETLQKAESFIKKNISSILGYYKVMIYDRHTDMYQSGSFQYRLSSKSNIVSHYENK